MEQPLTAPCRKRLLKTLQLTIDHRLPSRTSGAFAQSPARLHESKFAFPASRERAGFCRHAPQLCCRDNSLIRAENESRVRYTVHGRAGSEGNFLPPSNFLTFDPLGHISPGETRLPALARALVMECDDRTSYAWKINMLCGWWGEGSKFSVFPLAASMIHFINITL